jgi:glutathione peroxidase
MNTTLRAALAAVCSFVAMTASAASLYEIPVNDIDGNATTLAPFKGEVLLVVNVASKCGNTPQYAALEALYAKHKDEGFVVLGFPCNQFGGQEPGSNEQIKEFCSAEYGVTFPLFDKVDVNGANRHPLFVALAGDGAPFPGDVGWNFAKFLIGRDGTIVARFAPGTKPDNAEVTSAIAAALAAK